MISRRSLFGLFTLPFTGLACSPEPNPRPPLTAIDVPTFYDPDPLAALAERYAKLLGEVKQLDNEHTRVLKAEGQSAAYDFEDRWIDPVVRRCRPAELALHQAMRDRRIPAMFVGPWLIIDPCQTGEETDFYLPNNLAVFDFLTFSGKGGGR